MDDPVRKAAADSEPAGSRPASALVRGSVGRTLFRTALPLLAGSMALSAYNLTDTWFVSRLGTLPLAAMGFVFPVIMILSCVAMGIGSAVTTLTSHAIGRHDQAGAARLVTHGVMLISGITVLFATAGILWMDPIFAKLGADTEVLPYIRAFMHTWYAGALFMALPFLGNGVLVSTGDSRAASGFMIVGPVVNIALNPVLIFGLLGCPALGIRGSALATVMAQAVQTAWLLHLLGRKHRLLDRLACTWRDFGASVRRVAGFAVPAVLSMLLMPISATVITRILSGFGHEAVAASGAAGRIEMFAFMVPMALGISLTPFISQNVGAGRVDRVRTAYRMATRFALLYGAGLAVLFFIGAPWMSSLFTRDPKVSDVLCLSIRIVSFGYGMMEVHRYCGFCLTGLHRPVSATTLNVIRVIGLLVPLSFLGARLDGLRGVFLGRLATDVLTGIIGLIWVTRVLRRTGEAAPSTVPTKTGAAAA